MAESGSGAPESGYGSAESGSGVAVSGSGVAESGSCAPESGSGVAESGSGAAESGSGAAGCERICGRFEAPPRSGSGEWRPVTDPRRRRLPSVPCHAPGPSRDTTRRLRLPDLSPAPGDGSDGRAR